MYVGFSPDGFHWTGYAENPVLPTYPGGIVQIVPHGVGDIVDVYYDAPRRLYLAAVKVHAIPQDGYAPAPRAGKAFRRLVGLSTSRDFMHWDKPRRIIVPDGKDDGLLEFYGMGGIHRRGELTIGLVRVLRDDLACDPGGPRDGIGYTTLAASRDGSTWLRLREPFLDRNLGRGSWDHAMVWGSAVIPVGEELFIYYGGYARGHKVAPNTERQIGLARMRTDRYVAMATHREGRLITRPLLLPTGRLILNVQAPRGQVRVRLLDTEGGALDAPGNAVAEAITGDALNAEVRLPLPSGIPSRPVRLEFQLQQAALFGFSFAK
jgi:hypothetical protein